MRDSARFKPLIAMGLIGATTLLAYGAALRLPFFFDDLQHLVWLRNQTVGSILVSEAGRPYYRPMQFLAWKLYETITGNDSALLYHALNVILHMVNACLVVLLARRLSDHKDRWWPALLAGLIFVVFPYAYQVVPLPASLTHPMATLFVLLALLTYDRFQTTGHYRWLSSALGCAVLAFISNEGSILLAGLIGLFVFIRSPRDRRWLWIGSFVLLAAVYYLWYHSQQADSSGTVALRRLEPIVQNTIYVSEGLTFPLQPVGQWLMDRGLGDQAAVLLVAAITSAGVAALLFRAKLFRRFVFGVVWYGICLTPAVVLLSHNYLINSPRLMYLGSVGAALMWASVVEAVWGYHSFQPLRRVAAVIVAAAILLPAFVFVRQRMDLYTMTTAPLQSIITVADEAQSTDRLLFVNLPAWAGPARNWYPIGHEGVLLFYGDISMNDFLLANIGRALPTKAVRFDNVSEPQAYYYGIYGGASVNWDALNTVVRKADRVYLTRYAPDHVELVEAGNVTNTVQSAQATVATFGDAAMLEKATWTTCNNQLNVRLKWTAALGGDWHVFVHVLNPDGTLAAQHDSPPLLGLYAFWQWAPGDRVEDVHPIDVSQLPRDRPYTIAVGLYDPSDGERLTPTQASDQNPEDRAVGIGQFTIGGSPDTCR
jgi:hypothetical protein